MPRFFFHLHERGSVDPDEEGLAMSDLKSAVLLAVRLARKFAKANLNDGSHRGYHIEIENAETGERTIVPFRWAMLDT